MKRFSGLRMEVLPTLEVLGCLSENTELREFVHCQIRATSGGHMYWAPHIAGRERIWLGE